MRAIGYVRVSTDEQAERGYSLQDQRDRIRQYCEERQIELIEICSDDFTGKLLARPGLQQVSALADQRSFDLLICVKLDRLSRVNYLRRQYEEWLHTRGIGVLYVEQTFENTSAGRLQRGIMGELAEYESELIRERTIRGRIRKASDAKRIPVYCRTYGYHQISVAESHVIPEYLGRGGELVIVEDEAAIVRSIFALCAQGLTLDLIAQQLYDQQVKTRLNGIWSHSSVRNVLRNETYAGRLYYNRAEYTRTGSVAPGGTLQRRRSVRDASDWILIPCPAVVSEALFQIAQKRLDYNSERLRGRRTTRFLLHGCISCKRCLTRRGTPLACAGVLSINRIGNKTSNRYYRCTSRRRLDLEECKTTYRADDLEEMALDALKRASTRGRLAAIGRRGAEKASRQAGGVSGEISRIEKALVDLDTEESRLADVVLAGVSHTVIAAKVEEIHRRRRTLHQSLSQGRSLAASHSPADAEKRGEEAAEWLRGALAIGETDPAALAELFRLFLEVRIYRGEKPEIAVKIPQFFPE